MSPTPAGEASGASSRKRGRSGNSENNTEDVSAEPQLPSPSLLFSLRLVDDTAEADAILHGRNAERFLGVSASDFAADTEGVREKALERLQRCQSDESMYVDFYLKAYSTGPIAEEDGNVGTVAKRRNQTASSSSSSSSATSTASARKAETRRLQIFNTTLLCDE